MFVGMGLHTQPEHRVAETLVGDGTSQGSR